MSHQWDRMFYDPYHVPYSFQVTGRTPYESTTKIEHTEEAHQAHLVALDHIYAIMFGLPPNHAVQPYVAVIEAFLQREVMGRRLAELDK